MLAKESGALRISLLLAKSDSLRQNSIKHLRKIDKRLVLPPANYYSRMYLKRDYLQQAIQDERHHSSLYRDCSTMAEHRRLLELFRDGDQICLWNDFSADRPLTDRTIKLALFWGLLFSGFAIVGYSQLLAYQSLGYDVVNQDYLAFIEQLVDTLLGVKYVTQLLTEIIVGFQINMKALNHLENRFKAHLRHSAAFINSPNKFNHNRKTVERLASEAIELFVVIQKFAQNIDHFFRRTRFVLISLVFLVGSAEIPTIVLMDRADPAQVSVLLATSFIMATMSNVSFFSYSIFSAACIRVSRLAWTFIANTVYYQTISSNRHVEGSLMSPFTLMLWRKFVEDKEMLTDTFTITIFRYLRLNYSSVIRLNIWMFNIVLLFAGPFRAARAC